MALPIFNPEGTGPQGANGIPPEEFQKGLGQQDSALVNAGQNAENSPGVNRVMEGQVSELMREFGLDIPQAQAPAMLPNTPPAEVAPVSHAAQPGTDIDPVKLRGVIDKYQGDIGKMAAAYLSTDQARAQSQQAASTLERQYVEEIQNLRGSMQTMQQQLDQFFNGGGQAPPTPTQPVTPQTTDFWTNPTAAIQEIVQSNIMAAEQARASQERQRQFEVTQKSKAEEIDRLRPQMREMYRKHPILQQLPPEAALELLLDTAQAQELAQRAGQFYAEIQQFGGPAGNGNGNGAGVVIAPGAGGMGGGVGARTVNVPGAPAGGDWSRTPGMNNLIRSREGGSDEMGAITRVLEERGFYNNR